MCESKNVADWVIIDFVIKEEERKLDPKFHGGTCELYKHSPHRIAIEIHNDIETMASIITHETIHCILFELFYPNGLELSLSFDNSLASSITKFGRE